MVFETYVSKRVDKDRIYGVIWSLPSELIGKKVYILTEEEWKFIKMLLEVFYEAVKKLEEEYHRKIVKSIIEKTLTSIRKTS